MALMSFLYCPYFEAIVNISLKFDLDLMVLVLRLIQYEVSLTR